MELDGVCPDIMQVVTGKGQTRMVIGKGLITSTKLTVLDVLQRDYTWPRYLVFSALALRALDIIENENLIELCVKGGREFLEILKSELKGLHTAQKVRRTGVMIGVDLISDITTQIEQKVLLKHSNVLRATTNNHCLPPKYTNLLYD
ncbi:hypothetical protein HRS9122_10283 [Pyrenophora teres f. teres]|nr:hypothetical protein HRS9122_10283 [Pyrenophora teres f. teres]